MSDTDTDDSARSEGSGHSKQNCILCRGAEADQELGVVQMWEDSYWRMTTSLDAEVLGFRDSLIGYLYSMSFSSKPVLGDRREAFEEDIRQTLLEIHPSGQFTETVALEAYLAWRK